MSEAAGRAVAILLAVLFLVMLAVGGVGLGRAARQPAQPAAAVIVLEVTISSPAAPTFTATPSPSPTPTRTPTAAFTATPFVVGPLLLTVLPSSTPFPSETLMLTPTATVTYTATPSSTAVLPDQQFGSSPGEFVIGYSVDNRMISGWYYPAQIEGDTQALVLVNAIHGNEHNAGPVLAQLRVDVEAGTLALSSNLALYIIVALNPDGVASDNRFNARLIDLNRNWETYDWQLDTETAAGLIRGGGGPRPFSEPETQAMRDWLLARQRDHVGGLTVIYYHASFPPNGLVTPGTHLVDGRELADAESRRVGTVFAQGAGYHYSNFWIGGYPVTGDASIWAVAQGMRSITVELPVGEPLDEAQAGQLRAGFIAVLSWLSER